MSDISPTNPSHQPQPVHPLHAQKTYQAQSGQSTRPADHVELSDRATTAAAALDRLKELPDVRLDKVESARARLDELDNPAVLDQILDNPDFVDDLRG
ncbi:MAG: hypothetical protein R3236_02310 [Phycisphaeraceae bacterium]|nr:hypothetical protein [Phycisphaeraceae bacterium]